MGFAIEKNICAISPLSCPGEFHPGGNMVTVPWLQSHVCLPPCTRAVYASLPEGPWLPPFLSPLPALSASMTAVRDPKAWAKKRRFVLKRREKQLGLPERHDTITWFAIPVSHSLMNVTVRSTQHRLRGNRESAARREAPIGFAQRHNFEACRGTLSPRKK
jgi:hypothetical protein